MSKPTICECITIGIKLYADLLTLRIETIKKAEEASNKQSLDTKHEHEQKQK